MGDLACDYERVPMEGHDTSFIWEDDPVLLEEAFPPAGQTLCSCGELHYGQDGTHEQCMNGDSVETEVDISGSVSSGIKRGKECGGSSHVISDYSEPKESSTYDCSPSFLKHKKKRKSRGKNSGLHDAVHNLPALQDPGPSSPDDFGDLEPEVVNYDTGIGGQEPELGCGFGHEMLDEATSSHQASSYSLKMSFPAAEAS